MAGLLSVCGVRTRDPPRTDPLRRSRRRVCRAGIWGPATAGAKAGQISNLFRADVSKAEIARRLNFRTYLGLSNPQRPDKVAARHTSEIRCYAALPQDRICPACKRTVNGSRLSFRSSAKRIAIGVDWEGRRNVLAGGAGEPRIAEQLEGLLPAAEEPWSEWSGAGDQR